MDSNVVLETRDILDSEMNVIGQLSLPEGTSEEIWSEKLSVYLVPPVIHTVEIKDVTPRQIRQALVMSGITPNQIDSIISQLPEPIQTLARIEWEYSTAFQRNRPLVSQVGLALNWNSDQLDNLWILASTL